MTKKITYTTAFEDQMVEYMKGGTFLFFLGVNVSIILFGNGFTSAGIFVAVIAAIGALMTLTTVVIDKFFLEYEE